LNFHRACGVQDLERRSKAQTDTAAEAEMQQGKVKLFASIQKKASVRTKTWRVPVVQPGKPSKPIRKGNQASAGSLPPPKPILQ